jgi:hypothetical protein
VLRPRSTSSSVSSLSPEGLVTKCLHHQVDDGMHLVDSTIVELHGNSLDGVIAHGRNYV